MPITRTPIINDDGSGTTGTVWENAWKVELYNQIDGITPDVITVSTGGSITVDLPAPRRFYYLKVNPTSDLDISAVTAGRIGDLLLIQNIGEGPLIRLHYGVGQGFHLFNRVSSGPTPLAPRGNALYVWDGSWRLAQHDQGKAIRVPYNAANFPAGGSGTWTVTAGAVQQHDYMLQGDELAVTVEVYNSSISGTGIATLYVGGWPFTFSMGPGYPALAIPGSGNWRVMRGYFNAGSNNFGVTNLDGSPYSAGAVHFTFQARCRVN